MPHTAHRDKLNSIIIQQASEKVENIPHTALQVMNNNKIYYTQIAIQQAP